MRLFRLSLAAVLLCSASAVLHAQSLNGTAKECLAYAANARARGVMQIATGIRVHRVDDNNARVSVSLLGAASGYVSEIQPVRYVSQNGGNVMIPLGASQRITTKGAYKGMPVSGEVTLPVGGSVNAMCVTINGANHSRLQLIVPQDQFETEVGGALTVDTATTKPSCQKGCYLFTYTLPASCGGKTLAICCTVNSFNVDLVHCTISCAVGTSCPVVIEPKPGTGTGGTPEPGTEIH